MPELAAEAMIPNPRLAALAPLIGSWTTVGAHPMMPGVTLHGRASFEFRERLLKAIEDQNALLRAIIDRAAPPA